MKNRTRIFSHGVVELSLDELGVLCSLVEMVLDNAGVTFGDWAETNIAERQSFGDDPGPYKEDDVQRLLDRLNAEHKLLKG